METRGTSAQRSTVVEQAHSHDIDTRRESPFTLRGYFMWLQRSVEAARHAPEVLLSLRGSVETLTRSVEELSTLRRELTIGDACRALAQDLCTLRTALSPSSPITTDKNAGIALRSLCQASALLDNSSLSEEFRGSLTSVTSAINGLLSPKSDGSTNPLCGAIDMLSTTVATLDARAISAVDALETALASDDAGSVTTSAPQPYAKSGEAMVAAIAEVRDGVSGDRVEALVASLHEMKRELEAEVTARESAPQSADYEEAQSRDDLERSFTIATGKAPKFTQWLIRFRDFQDYIALSGIRDESLEVQTALSIVESRVATLSDGEFLQFAGLLGETFAKKGTSASREAFTLESLVLERFGISHEETGLLNRVASTAQEETTSATMLATIADEAKEVRSKIAGLSADLTLCTELEARTRARYDQDFRALVERHKEHLGVPVSVDDILARIQDSPQGENAQPFVIRDLLLSRPGHDETRPLRRAIEEQLSSARAQVSKLEAKREEVEARQASPTQTEVLERLAAAATGVERSREAPIKDILTRWFDEGYLRGGAPVRDRALEILERTLRQGGDATVDSQDLTSATKNALALSERPPVEILPEVVDGSVAVDGQPALAGFHFHLPTITVDDFDTIESNPERYSQEVVAQAKKAREVVTVALGELSRNFQIGRFTLEMAERIAGAIEEFRAKSPKGQYEELEHYLSRFRHASAGLSTEEWRWLASRQDRAKDWSKDDSGIQKQTIQKVGDFLLRNHALVYKTRRYHWIEKSASGDQISLKDEKNVGGCPLQTFYVLDVLKDITLELDIARTRPFLSAMREAIEFHDSVFKGENLGGFLNSWQVSQAEWTISWFGRVRSNHTLRDQMGFEQVKAPLLPGGYTTAEERLRTYSGIVESALFVRGEAVRRNPPALNGEGPSISAE